ncbi:MAG TPA: ATP-binding protein, partial [Bacteroidia bacterium]|nr:ATP-binding protein [Bacteroidia bacterium]
IFDTTVAMHKFMDNTVKMMFKYSSKLSDPYLSDPDRWQIILNNLVSNSIKFARVHADSYIHLDVAKVSDELVVTFEDNGIGIPAAQLDSIFEMFYRATDASAGSGLGLYIVRQTVELLGGSITVDSKTGVFTRFTIRMPFVNNAPQIYAEKSYRTA